MFPDIEDFSQHDDFILYHGPSSGISLSSSNQDPVMHTLVAGLQDMFRRQIAATQEECVHHHCVKTELKTLFTPASVLIVQTQQAQETPIGQ
jgi:hypothetical protein